ncbi:PREDICTED: cadherin-7-like isoform X2 [Poecilia mexicana]|uniref:cadherin-7-like isoform X2 n=1 Tax=Poecilia mexicana TaxID=48701 RepID=UPI00072EAD5B|nr:PREDICTED: cadherin-7-like isoform X2 [Poecilia mexicana]
MGAGEEMHARTVKMSTPGVLAVVTVFSMIPGGLLSDIRDTQGLEGQQLARGSTVLHHRQKRGWIWKQLFVQEEDPTSQIIGQVKSDSDRGSFTIKYVLSGEGAGDVFKIDENSGEIWTLKKLDREKKAFYVLQAQAINTRTEEPVEPQSEFIIKVQDINDNAPQFLNEPYVSSIPEMSPVGTTVAQVTATDADDPMFGNNAKLIYSILQGEPYFSVQPKTDVYTFALPENAAIGTTVGRIMAEDGDIGSNAKMTYRLEDDLNESSTFNIETDPVTQEGVILLAMPLDYESKRRYTMVAEAANNHPDTRFLPLDEFSDRTTLKIFVEDVDEPPVFLSALYEWKIPENAAVGTVVGTVSARDTDTVKNPIRYSIDKKTDATNAFKIDPNNGTIAIAKALDRETADWHNMSVEAKETMQNRLSSSVAVFITVLDVNDNVPRLARDYQPYICEGTQAGELIHLLSAVDPDKAVEEHHFYYSMVPQERINPNFTIRDNQDNTAGIVARRSTFTRKDQTQYLLPVVVTDSGTPALSSTTTLTIGVCSCLPAGQCPTAGVEALALSGVSMQTLVGIFVCLVTLTALSVLMLIVRRHRRKQQEGTDVEVKELELPDTFSQKVLYYGERGAGLDFCQPPVPLRPHPRRRDRKLRREEVRASIRMSLRESHLIGPEDEVFRQFILDRLAEADQDPYVPPFDCLRTYAYEGSGSSSGSLSSLDSCLEFEPEKPVCNSKPYAVRLTPWFGGAEEDTFF